MNPPDEVGQSPGNGPVETPDGLRSAEDQEQSLAGTELEPRPGGLAIDVGEIAYRGPGEITGVTAGQGRACIAEADRDHGRQPGRRPDAPPRYDVAFPEDDRDPERGGRQHHRDCRVATRREDRGRPVTGEDGGGLRNRGTQPQRIQDEVDVALDGPQRSDEEPLERDPCRLDDRRLEAAMAAEPADVRRVGKRAQRPGDGEGRVDVAARSPARDQQTHRSRFPSRRSPVTPTGGCRRRSA